MAERTTIYVGAPLQEALRMAGAENRSGRINTIAERYNAIVVDEVARLRWTRNQWCAALDVWNGSYLLEDYWRHMWADLEESVADETDMKWEVDLHAMAQQVRQLSAAGKIALVEVTERFWSRTHLPTDEALAEAGVKPAS